MRSVAHRWTDPFVRRADGGAPDALAIRLLVWMAVAMSAGGVVWTGLAVGLGYCWAALVPVAYVVITAVNLGLFYRTGRFALARAVQVMASLFLPLIFQLVLGGFVASGAVMMWGLMALVASLTFSNPRQAAGTLAMFAVGTVVVTWLDESAAAWMSQPSWEQGTWLFCANMVMVSSMVALLTGFVDHLRKSQFRELSQAHDLIHELNDDLRLAEQAARDANQTKSRFVANMSHELRTPLNAIIGYAELMRDDAEDDGLSDMAGDATRVLAAGRHLLSLINDVLDHSRLEAGEMSVFYEEVHVDHLVAEVVEMMTPLAAENGNVVRSQVRVEGTVHTDSRKVRQILLNLLGNANKFTTDGAIGVTARRLGGRLVLEVSDTGIGMSAEVINRVMLPFQQADSSTTRQYGGTGLGLHLVSEFARMLGGQVVLTSEEGSGTTVTVTLEDLVSDHPSLVDASADSA